MCDTFLANQLLNSWLLDISWTTDLLPMTTDCVRSLKAGSACHGFERILGNVTILL